MDTILPIKQNLFPVSFKRKLEYEGYYLREIVDKNKLKIWFKWLKRNNIHFADKELDEDLIDKFFESSKKMEESLYEEIKLKANPEDELVIIMPTTKPEVE